MMIICKAPTMRLETPNKDNATHNLCTRRYGMSSANEHSLKPEKEALEYPEQSRTETKRNKNRMKSWHIN